MIIEAVVNIIDHMPLLFWIICSIRSSIWFPGNMGILLLRVAVLVEDMVVAVLVVYFQVTQCSCTIRGTM